MPEALISAGTALINALAHVKRTRARLSVLIRLPPRYDEITQQVAQRRTINHKIVLEVSGIYSRHCSEHELCTTVVGHTGFICPYQHASYMHLLGKQTAAQFRVCIAPSAFQLFRGRNEVLRGRKLIKGTLARNQKKKKMLQMPLRFATSRKTFPETMRSKKETPARTDNRRNGNTCSTVQPASALAGA